MRALATKSDAEREDDEASRLVREAPKDKPPRRDRRRERMQPERDRDTAGDPDLNGEDTSLNYKTIGGSTVDRVALRFVVRTATRRSPKNRGSKKRKQKKIPALSKETGETVFISPETLKTEPGKYEQLKPKKDDSSGVRPPLPAGAAMSNGPPPVAPPKQPGAAPSDPKAKGEGGGGPAPPGPGAEPAKRTDEPSDDEDEYAEVALDDEKDDSSGVPPLPGAAAPNGPPQEPQGDAQKATKKPTVAEGRGIKPPQQREVSTEERAEVALTLVDTLPAALAAKLIARGIHPDDAKTLISSFKAASSRPVGNPGEFAAKVAKIYQTDPDQVEPPKTWRTAKGKKVSFEELPPDEQATAYRQHQMQVVAMSLAARGQLETKLSFDGVIPPNVVQALVGTLLGSPKPSAEPDPKGKPQGDADRDEDESQKKTKLSKLPDTPDLVFAAISESKGFVKIPEGLAKQMLASVKDNPAAQGLVRALLEGNDYKRAKDLYLGDGALSERDDSKTIAEGLKAARDFFKVRGSVYGSDGQDGAKRFETKVLTKLRSLDPEKYKKVRQGLDVEDAKTHDQALKAHERAKEAHEKALAKWDAQPVFTRGEAPKPPTPPVEPAGYSNARRPVDTQREGRELWDDLYARSGVKKTAARVACKYLISSYLHRTAMVTTSTSRPKQGLYHGIAPSVSYPREPYPEAVQVPSRGLADSDHEKILASARRWLASAVLTQGMTGLASEQKSRFALDLALSDGAYNVDSTQYDTILAKLLGVTDPGSVLRTASLEEQIFRKFAPDSRSKSGGRLNVMLTGATAKALQKPSYSTVALAELDPTELQTLAAALKIKTATQPPVSSFAFAGEGTPSTALSAIPTTETVNMLRLSSEQKTTANQSLATIDKTAQLIQENFKSWGIPFRIARDMVNHLDKTADAVETLVYGQSSLRNRQAEIAVQSADFAKEVTKEGLLSRAEFSKAAKVIQRDSDEKYMDTFNSPTFPIETDADEPYMSAYRDDQSQGVSNGEDVTGRDLAP